MKNSINELQLRKTIERLSEEGKKLKKIIKDTHVEIEWLDIEMKAFTKTFIWKLGYIIKNLKFPKK